MPTLIEGKCGHPRIQHRYHPSNQQTWCTVCNEYCACNDYTEKPPEPIKSYHWKGGTRVKDVVAALLKMNQEAYCETRDQYGEYSTVRRVCKHNGLEHTVLID